MITAAPTEPPRDKLRLGIDWRWWGRNASFSGVAPTEASFIGVAAVPTGATFDIQWFPAAYFVDDRGADVGVTLRTDFAPDFKTRSLDHSYKSSVMRLRTGLMFRLPFHHVEPSFHAGYQVFEATTATTASDGTPRPRAPNVTFQGPRLGLNLRLLEFWRITFDLGFGATALVTTGELGSPTFYPAARGAGYDGQVGIAFRTWPFLDVRLGVDVMVHDVSLGGGAKLTDAYYGVSLGIVFKGVP
jgi:hypothetical protein